MSSEFDRVVLWFEHDLYDQLQLLQVLDWFATHPRAEGMLLLVQAEDYIGRQEREAVERLAATAVPVTQAQLELAARAWGAFRQPTPEAWAHLLEEHTAALPCLRSAVVRMLEELPGADGLSRTERQRLATIEAAESITALGLFAAVQKQEDAQFMGDWSFWRLLDQLALAEEPLVAGLEAAPFQNSDLDLAKTYLTSRLALTSLGKAVLAGGADWTEHHTVDCWWGGTHLTEDTAVALGSSNRGTNPRGSLSDDTGVLVQLTRPERFVRRSISNSSPSSGSSSFSGTMLEPSEGAWSGS